MSPPDRTDDDDIIDVELLAQLVAPAAPTTDLRAALLQAMNGPWWAPFARRARSLLDLDDDATAALFASTDDGDRWMAGPADSVQLFHIDAGPALAGAITGFVRLAPGAQFPHHRHVGHETVLVLEGSFVDGGRVHAAGEEVTMPPSSAHDLVAGPQGCLYLAVVLDGLAFDGEDPIGPDDPRA
jgi:quercetin dioxygenase-like cupin family protein